MHAASLYYTKINVTDTDDLKKRICVDNSIATCGKIFHSTIYRVCKQNTFGERNNTFCDKTLNKSIANVDFYS